MRGKVKVVRISSIIDGYPTLLTVNGKRTYIQGRENGKGLYVVIRKRRCYEDQIPIGEEVTL